MAPDSRPVIFFIYILSRLNKNHVFYHHPKMSLSIYVVLHLFHNLVLYNDQPKKLDMYGISSHIPHTFQFCYPQNSFHFLLDIQICNTGKSYYYCQPVFQIYNLSLCSPTKKDNNPYHLKGKRPLVSDAELLAIFYRFDSHSTILSNFKDFKNSILKSAILNRKSNEVSPYLWSIVVGFGPTPQRAQCPAKR